MKFVLSLRQILKPQGLWHRRRQRNRSGIIRKPTNCNAEQKIGKKNYETIQWLRYSRASLFFGQMDCEVAELWGLNWNQTSQGDFGMVTFKWRTKDRSGLTAGLFEGFPGLGNLFGKMESILVLLKTDLLWRGCKTRSHRTMEGQVQNKGKVWVVLKSPYMSTKFGWRDRFRQWFGITEGAGRRGFFLVRRCIEVAVDDEFRDGLNVMWEKKNGIDVRFTYPLKAGITKRKELSYCIKYEKQLDSVKIAISNTGNEACCIKYKRCVGRFSCCIKYKHWQRVAMSVGDGRECENLNKGGSQEFKFRSK